MKKLGCLLLLLVNISFCSYAQRAQDSLALVALYNSTGGPNWTNKTNWLSSQPISTWYGVTIENSRVTVLRLLENNLKGSIPTELQNLTNLTTLDLGSNQLSGIIPSEIGFLSSLTSLRLYHNSFTGTIPPQIENLTNLKNLQLYDNKLSGNAPNGIWNLTKLEILDLHGNYQLGGSIPPEIGLISNLACLNFGECQFIGSIPHEIGNLKNLSALVLSSNKFSGTIPLEIYSLTNLTWLDLGNIPFGGAIPPEIRNLTKLKNLFLYKNQITGNIPSEIWDLVNLEQLGLNCNNITGSIPTEIGNLTKLQNLFLQENNLTGMIPKEIGNLKNLYRIFLSNNQFFGSIPIEINNLTQLNALWIEDNRFTEMPAMTQSSLSELFVRKNRLTFKDLEPNINVPRTAFVYSPQDSTGIKQDINSRTGKAYSFSSNCGGAHNVYQWYKNNIPITNATDRIYKISRLRQSDAGSYSCAVTNTIVTGLTIISRPINLSVTPNGRALDSLALVILYNSTGGANWTKNTNWLSSQPISTWYGVTVGNNGTKGDLNDTTSVIKLDLSNNNLSGTIPKEIGNMTALQTLNLDNNHLSGSIPEGINNLCFLQTLELSNNNLSDLPTLTHSSLNTLLINNNEFSFEDILPNLSVPIGGFNYLSQDSIGVRKDTLCRVGKSIEFFAIDGANHNNYQWYKDGTAITRGSSYYYRLSNLQESDSGSYTCKITNTIVPGLTINQRPIRLHINIKTGVNDIDINALKVYPNPTGGIIYFEIDRSLPAKTKIVITDIYGKAVFIKVLEVSKKQELNLTRLSKGIYFLQIQNQNNRYFQKVVIR